MRQELTRHAFARIKGGGIVVKYTAHQASKYEVPQGTTKESPHESVSTIKSVRANFPRNGETRELKQ